jgi:hypothetical protein
MDQQPKLIIVVINYGTIELIKELVKNFLSSLPRFPKIRIDWIIADAVDDLQNQESNMDEWQHLMRSEIKNKKRNFFYFLRIRNLGFAGNVNQSMSLFKKNLKENYQIEKSDLVLLLNPDTSLYWINLEKAVDFMKNNPSAAVAGMSLTNPKGLPEKWGHSTIYPNLKYIGRKRFSEPSFTDKPTPVAWVSGGAMMIRFEWWQKLKGLDPGYFFYFEDVDFCNRVKEKGGSIFFLPQAIVNHRRGGSDISIYRRKRHYYASEARYFHIYHSPSDYLLLRLIRFPYKLFYFARCYLVPSYWVLKIKAAKEFMLCEKREGYPTFCTFANSFINIPLIKGLWIASVVLNLVILGESIWGRFYLSSPLILHYNAYLGIDYYGDTTSLFTFPLVALLMSLFNFTLGIILLLSKRYLPFVIIPAGASLAFQLTISGALLNLLIVNS